MACRISDLLSGTEAWESFRTGSLSARNDQSRGQPDLLQQCAAFQAPMAARDTSSSSKPPLARKPTAHCARRPRANTPLECTGGSRSRQRSLSSHKLLCARRVLESSIAEVTVREGG